MSALIGLAAFVYTARFGDTLLGVILVYACGPLTVFLALVAWWRTRTFAPRVIAMVAVLLGIALMGMLGYVLWWVTAHSAIASG